MAMKTQEQQPTRMPPSHAPLVQRKCSCGGKAGFDGECATCRAARLNRQPSPMQRGTPALAPSIVHEVLRTAGQPLSQKARASLEPHFGHDFSRVRIHTNAQAVASARAVQALAYTVGRNVVFGQGQYRPETEAGKSLLAHELTHVVQQSGTDHLPGTIAMVSPNDKSEQEAENAAKAVGSAQPFAVALHEPSGLARQEDELESDAGELDPEDEDRDPPDAGALPPADAGPPPVDAGTPPPAAATPCPTSVTIGQVSGFNHSNLSAADKEQFATYLGTVSRMDVGPGKDHNGHCMKEKLTTISNNCPPEVYTRQGGKASAPCTGNKCLDINQHKNAGDPRTSSTLSDGPTSFIDMHRTFNARSLLENTTVNACTVVCEQTYTCDRTQATTGTFKITRNYKAGTHTKADGTTMPITSGTVAKT